MIVVHLCLFATFWSAVWAIHPDCAIITQLIQEEEICTQTKNRETNQTQQTGCGTDWDGIRCWNTANTGQILNVSCSEVFQQFSNNQGFIYRNCTSDGWSDPYPSYDEACAFEDDSESGSVTTYFSTLKRLYTAGYATSLISLITAVIIFTYFRKFHCTRNYIHVNLFVSFILRASAVFIKDAVLFSDETQDHCLMSTVACKTAVAFFQFCILTNYFWLLVEGMYLQTLLALTFVSQRKYFWWYILIGWGVPSVVLIVWVLTRQFYDNRGCWDDTDNMNIWWIIKGPITVSLLANIIIFLNVIRILVQKLKSPGVGGSDTGHFMRLAKSTLFLIPLFGMHYTVFAFLPENTGEIVRFYIELGLGSFQGFVVALLYCFLNGEVQAELKRTLLKWQTQSHLSPSKKRRITITQISMHEVGGTQAHICNGNITSV
ncbi:growth hormone releasing hormone receptor a [Triplophysa rosa]|uniref:Growth-hormone releasing hormone-like peptide receptor n=1 Tax=Triplophysa rosa TaxID=992332 RepID=A0A9W8C822_TRIRA|nr:growth hormone releasing hormone receptor a [Triplophysa rosa]KAI7809953.1 growth-hormone releasing hormone-like peptide receptor [Triplophysa rosa]